jgi:hypothetical protein
MQHAEAALTPLWWRVVPSTDEELGDGLPLKVTARNRWGR